MQKEMNGFRCDALRFTTRAGQATPNPFVRANGFSAASH
jgi:hypothetical protein